MMYALHSKDSCVSDLLLISLPHMLCYLSLSARIPYANCKLAKTRCLRSLAGLATSYVMLPLTERQDTLCQL